MLADFYMPRLSNDTNIAVQKNNLNGVKFGTYVWTLLKTASVVYRCINRHKKNDFFLTPF